MEMLQLVDGLSEIFLDMSKLQMNSTLACDDAIGRTMSVPAYY